MVNWGDACILITGSGSGIGKAATLRFLEQNARVTALDASFDALQRLQHESRRHHARLLTITCDVSDDAAQEAAFKAHISRWGRLDFALLNAGIGAIFTSADLQAWQPTLDIDLRAVLVGTQLAVRAMHAHGTRGTIVSLASAAGIFTAGADVPVYSAAKGGLVHFTRSSGKALARQGIHLATVCPQFVDTPLLDDLPAAFRSSIPKRMGPLLSTDRVLDEIVSVAEDRSRSGAAVVLLQNGRTYDYNPVHRPGPQGRAAAAPRAGAASTVMPVGALPAQYRLWQVQRLSADFRAAVSLETAATPREVAPECVLVKRLITGVNASDVNFTSGVYHGSKKAAQAQLPFVAGFESVGVVAKAGQDSGFQVGQPVATLSYGGFSEFAVEKARFVVPVPTASAATVAFLTSGLTASVSLDEVRPRRGETALVTAAAGGTGLFAVQLLKHAGLHVVGTCGSESKAQLLRGLGVDRVVNYKTENLKKVLQKEYAKGVNIVYEGVGGEMFKVAVDALAQRGRLLIIGMMSQYGKGWPLDDHPGLPEKLLKKSASLIGFFLPSHASKYKQHLDKLMTLHGEGKLKVFEDSKRFVGIESVPDAVQRLQSGDSFGKVVVYIDPAAAPAKEPTPSKL